MTKHKLIKCIQKNGKDVYSVEFKGTIEEIKRYANLKKNFTFCPTNDTEFEGHWHTNKPRATYVIDDPCYKNGIQKLIGLLRG